MRFRILHFNDVYDASKHAAQLSTALQSHLDVPSIVLFGGDALGPSMQSSLTFGSHMIDVLNEMQINYAVLGNHEFDFGTEVLEKMRERSNFEWICCNIRGGCEKGCKHKIFCGRHNGTDVYARIFGFAHKEWTECDEPHIDEDGDYCINIALTHMSRQNDFELAAKCKNLHMICGGHDHDESIDIINGTLVCKAGNDFKSLCVIDVNIDDRLDITLSVKMVDVSTYFPNPKISSVIEESLVSSLELLNVCIGMLNRSTDCRYNRVRTSQCSIGNFVADCACEYAKTDAAIINGGTIRYNDILHAGPLYNKDLLKLIPMQIDMVVLEMKGSRFTEIISAKPSVDGGFLFWSGKVTDVMTVCIPKYLYDGGDGFELKEFLLLRDEESTPTLNVSVRMRFYLTETVKKIAQNSKYYALRKCIRRLKKLPPLGYTILPPEHR